MEIIRINSSSDIIKFKFPLTATIGEFDGIHIAHQELLNKTLELSKINNTKSAVITFDPHPDILIKKDQSYKSIFSLDKKIKELSKYSFDYLFIINFSVELLKLNHEIFTKKYLEPLNIHTLIIGFNFTYGYKGLGNYQTLQEEGNFDVIMIPKMMYNDEIVSSTLIKEKLFIGNLEDATILLGGYFSILGEVIHGRNIGEKINVPTANLKLLNNYPNLKEGVYVVNCIIDDKKYPGIANIGHNPSFNYYDDLSYEIHIIEEDFNINLYGKNINVEFVKYLRSEQKFNSVEEFISQIQKDKKEAKIVLKY